MICLHCGNQIVQSRYGWQASTLCMVCLENWRNEERELLAAMKTEDDDESENSGEVSDMGETLNEHSKTD